MANQFLSLGMFIMLLSFFIVLNSMSQFEEEKSQSVIKSLNESFWKQPDTEKESFAKTIAPPSESFREGDALERVKALFQSTIPDVQAKKNRLGTELNVRVKRTDFEAALNGILAPEEAGPSTTVFTERFTAILAGLLDTKISQPYAMEILLNLEQSPALLQKNDPDTIKAAVKTAASYAQILQKEGLDQKLLTPGLSQGAKDTVTLVFKLYSPIKLEVRSNGQ